MQIRRLPKPVVAMVAGYAVGGGHVLHMICDLTVGLLLHHMAVQFLPACFALSVFTSHVPQCL